MLKEDILELNCPFPKHLHQKMKLYSVQNNIPIKKVDFLLTTYTNYEHCYYQSSRANLQRTKLPDQNDYICVMPNLNKTYLYRMTHIDNIPHILEYGVTHINSPNANKNYVPIGDGSLINTRSNFTLKNGKLLGDYIPFYFGKLTPMLYVIQNGFNNVKTTYAQDIVYCVSSPQQIINANLDFIFTDGHAIDAISSQYDPSHINNLENLLDFTAINDSNFKDSEDLDKKRRKQAEFLVDSDVPKEAIIGFVVYNEAAQLKLIAFGVEKKQIVVKKDFYF